MGCVLQNKREGNLFISCDSDTCYIYLHLSNSDIFGTSSHPWGHLSTWEGVAIFCFELHNLPRRWNAGLISAKGCLHQCNLLLHSPAPLASSLVRPGSRLLGVLRGQMSHRYSTSSELQGASCAHVKEPEGGCPARANGGCPVRGEGRNTGAEI